MADTCTAPAAPAEPVSAPVELGGPPRGPLESPHPSASSVERGIEPTPEAHPLERVASVHSMRDIPFAQPAASPRESHSSLDMTDQSSRLISLSGDQSQTQIQSQRPKHSSLIRLDDLYTLDQTRQQLEADIRQRGPLSVNAIILSSIFERINEGLAEAVPALFQSEDAAQFASLYYPLRDVFHHLQRIGPVGNCLPNASRLSSLIKWDFRQLINSFLTLIRTSPGFVATALSELPNTERKLFSGGARVVTDIDEIMSAQRLSPLGILFYGLLRDTPQRVNYFAAMCAQLLDGDRIITSVMLKFSRGPFTARKPKMDLFLRRLLRSGQSVNLGSGSGGTLGTATTATSLRITTHDDFWAPQVEALAVILREYVSVELRQFVAALSAQVDVPARVHALALEFFKNQAKGLLTNPHAYELLVDCHVSEQTHKSLLVPLSVMVCSYLDSDEAFRAHLFGSGLEFADLGTYYEHNQLIVLSLQDITYLYSSLLPVRRGSPRMDDDNEWCLDNIRADLEPVMKELSVRLPTSGRSRAVQQQGVFLEFWQVFKIEQDGLVNDMDAQSWSPCVTCPRLTFKNGDSTDAIIAQSIAESDAAGNFLDSGMLRRIQGHAQPLNTLVHDLDRCVQLLTSHRHELSLICEQHTAQFHRDQAVLVGYSSALSLCRAHVWYEHEVRPSPVFLRALEVTSLLKGELGLQRSNSSSSSRRFSARPRRLSILSGASVMDSFFVSKDYLLKPKLADREIDASCKYLRSHRVHNFCRSEELIHRFNCEASALLSRVLERDFLGSSACYKKDLKSATAPSNHRMSMSVLPDLSTSRSRSRKSSPNLLLDIFEWKAAAPSDASMGLETEAGTLPERDLVCGLILSDLDWSRASETDEFMQQTGRMLLDGDGLAIQPVLEFISLQSTPRAKLRGFQTLVAVVRAQLEAENGQPPSRHDVTYELGKLFGREPGTLYADLQTVSGFVPTSAPELDAGQPFWDVAEAALKTLDLVVGKSMDLAARMLKYNETNKSSSLVNTMGVNDAVAIWSFCARHGRPKAQRKLAELYAAYPSSLLDVLPFTKPAILFEAIEPSNVRPAVIAHWMQAAAQKGEPKAVEFCRAQREQFI